MIQTGKESKESLPDDESFDLVVSLMLQADQIDAALKNIDLTLKSGYMLSVNVFTECVRSCVNKGRLDTLVSIIERCKVYLIFFFFGFLKGLFNFTSYFNAKIDIPPLSSPFSKLFEVTPYFLMVCFSPKWTKLPSSSLTMSLSLEP